MRYRKEIDGLRALAVLPVILFHAGFSAFSGGFVGVDIFFVISGYLITTIIVSEVDEGKFSILNFYDRRARRILPTLFFVMLCTLPFAWFWMLPTGLKDYAKSLMAVPVFSSNVLFYFTSGYFDIASDLKPLLHTWSLAVEEQYYVLFPLFIMLTWKFGKKWVVSSLLLLAAMSVLAAQIGSSQHAAFTFYSLPTRGFEILIGALVALYINHKQDYTQVNRQVAQLASFIGLILVLYAIFVFDKYTPSPSLYSLIPTVGAGLIIVFANRENIVGRMLGNRLLVGIGLISYSAYLWHQPVLVFSRLKSLFGYDMPNPILAVGASLVLAYLTWRFIEKPFRNKSIINSKSILLFSVLGTGFFITAGAIVYSDNGFRDMKDRVPPNVTWLTFGEKLLAKGDVCTLTPYGKSGFSVCFFGDLNSPKNSVLYGDSHSQAISEELNKAFMEMKVKGIKISLDGCDVVPELKVYSRTNTDVTDRCMVAFKNMLEYIGENKADVIVASRWTFKVYPIKGEVEDMPSKNSEGGVENDSAYREYVSVVNGSVGFDAQAKKMAINHFLDGLLTATDKLYLIYPIPEISWDIARKNVAFYQKNGKPLQEISISYADFEKRNKFIDAVFDEYENNAKVLPVRPETVFCNTFEKNRCVAQYNTVPYYYDDDHVSDAGARLIVHEIIQRANSVGGYVYKDSKNKNL